MFDPQYISDFDNGIIYFINRILSRQYYIFPQLGALALMSELSKYSEISGVWIKVSLKLPLVSVIWWMSGKMLCYMKDFWIG